jgi:uncharacterized protein YndB with AHSA1/START domain
MKMMVSAHVNAPVMDVWKAYTNPDDIMVWNAASSDWHTTAATVDLRPGGKFFSRMEAKDGSSGFDFAGEYTRVVPVAFIEYRFGDRIAQVEFAEDADGVRITVSFDPETLHSEEQQRQGWQAILDNFVRYVKG